MKPPYPRPGNAPRGALSASSNAPRGAFRSPASPAPRSLKPRPISEDIVWTREIQPRERYRIQYTGSDGIPSLREIELLRLGAIGPVAYLGVRHLGVFKTLRSERVGQCEQLSEGHAPSIHAFPTYRTVLPAFPKPDAVLRMPTMKGKRTWLVDLNAYVCACPEKRIREAKGYRPGELGSVCPHLARAILDHLPAEHLNGRDWTPELLSFLSDPRKVHIDNLA